MRTKPPFLTRRPWTAAEQAELRRAYGSVRAVDLATQLRRSHSSVLCMAKQLGLTFRQVERSSLKHQHHMGPESLARLREMHAAGASDPEIGAAIGFRAHAIWAARKRLGLASTYSNAGRSRAGHAGMRRALEVIALGGDRLKLQQIARRAIAVGNEHSGVH